MEIAYAASQANKFETRNKFGGDAYFLQRTTQKYDCGNGTCLNPLRVIICEVTPRNMTVSF